MTNASDRKTVSAIRVSQWLPAWDEIEWEEAENRSEPPKWFYVFSLPAHDLRRLSGVYRRTTKRETSAQDKGIQRELDQERAREIGRFVKFGYPWSDLSAAKRKSKDYRDLRQPGWLPTAVIVNILTRADTRREQYVDEDDLIQVKDAQSGAAMLTLPPGLSRQTWSPAETPPIEIIDGQHRLAAFTDEPQEGSFELPVVAFVGLDLSWQAYLFYTVNIKPKKINASLAFDLYPLLRTEKWLEKFEGHSIYRETRAQELVDRLWSSQDSPWHHRINMLGSRGAKGLMATQSAWVRSIMASFVKSWEGRGVRIGGLFGSKVGVHKTVLPWNLDVQGAFLIFIGNALRDAIAETKEDWAVELRTRLATEAGDPAFFGQHNLLNQDQGIRTLLQVTNDLCYQAADELGLDDVIPMGGLQQSSHRTMHETIKVFAENERLGRFIGALAQELAKYDWRASGCPGLTDEQRTLKASFRGSGGYNELRRSVLMHLKESKSKHVSNGAQEASRVLGYDQYADG
ncbi:DGQHR domain-containing protein [Candidatus Foliamicus sp.]